MPSVSIVRTRNAALVKALFRRWHGTHPPPVGWLVAEIGKDEGGRYVGVQAWGHPNARLEDQSGATIEHLRQACAPDHPKKFPSSFLRAGRERLLRERPEVKRFIAYVDGATHVGVTYRGDKWKRVSEAKGGSWTRKGRSRTSRPLKVRWKFEWRRP